MRTVLTVLYFIEFIISLFLLTPRMTWLIIRRNKLGERRLAEETYKTANRWVKFQLGLAGVKVVVEGIENIPNEPCVYIGNHQSFVDIAALLSVNDRPKGFIAKLEMSHIPVLSKFMLFIKCVFIDRNDIRQSAKAINAGIANVKDGYSMVIYPEGTRSRAHTMIEWKHGAFKLATKSGVPIVPITTIGAYKILEGNNYRIRRGKVKVVFHKPVPTKDLPREEQIALPDKIKEIIQKELDKFSEGL